MKNTRKLRFGLIGLAVLLTGYISAYVGASRKGFYQPAVYGLLAGPDGQSILAPKGAFGYYWTPFETHKPGGDLRLKAIFFYPLVKLDRRLWHTAERMESGAYRVKNYFDYETMTYRAFGATTVRILPIERQLVIGIR